MSLYNGYSSVHNSLRSGLHMLTGDVRSFVASTAFTKAMKEAEESVDTKAFLIIKALDGLALDPLTGKHVGSFITRADGMISCHVRFDRWVNFIGLFSLPESSGRATQLVEAVDANIGGRMFKAAAMYRRLDRRAVRLHESARRKARAAFALALEKSRDTVNARGWVPKDSDYERANAEYDRVFEPRKALISGRLMALGKIASPGFLGSYTEAVASFLYQHLPCH
ncbi:hypothetical protein [Cupriavidus sp. TMH.W2]|uniref:hypothetical protein n=1 Tax=Cupriavidus sp. TMH.W2 TaxID=3434465 RepID=UPI003D78971D